MDQKCRCGRLATYDNRCEDCWAIDQSRYNGRVTKRAKIELADHPDDDDDIPKKTKKIVTRYGGY